MWLVQTIVKFVNALKLKLKEVWAIYEMSAIAISRFKIKQIPLRNRLYNWIKLLQGTHKSSEFRPWTRFKGFLTLPTVESIKMFIRIHTPRTLLANNMVSIFPTKNSKTNQTCSCLGINNNSATISIQDYVTLEHTTSWMQQAQVVGKFSEAIVRHLLRRWSNTIDWWLMMICRHILSLGRISRILIDFSFRIKYPIKLIVIIREILMCKFSTLCCLKFLRITNLLRKSIDDLVRYSRTSLHSPLLRGHSLISRTRARINFLLEITSS